MSFNMRLYMHRMHQLDSNVCVAVNHTSQYRLIRDSFRIASRLGDGIFWYALMLGVLVFKGTEGLTSVIHMASAGLVGTLLYKWLKGKTLRPRPYQVRQDIYLTGIPLDKFSFPSGHTLHAVVFTVVALSYFPHLSFFLVPFTLMVALSRVVLGLHYPSDVIAGALLGSLIGGLSFLFV
ncbi:MAG: phosphatase PAP2 family protein [Methylotenera sp.]|nr:phosphatase PAP2 family protein [Methylotenera sp.]MDO9232868.1 phosphatase PAP2 family protein [Methylotenera sp.]MDO9389100.1 phosphatase PAP2 family protein [Methylotenera sp.]MDP2102885.1 phosphatase PAP2 family protein [Methylotenera sp.]MDP2281352.1 phosphatase PAP2 family protein [Methylotenera sp.]